MPFFFLLVNDQLALKKTRKRASTKRITQGSPPVEHPSLTEIQAGSFSIENSSKNNLQLLERENSAAASTTRFVTLLLHLSDQPNRLNLFLIATKL